MIVSEQFCHLLYLDRDELYEDPHVMFSYDRLMDANENAALRLGEPTLKKYMMRALIQFVFSHGGVEGANSYIKNKLENKD